MPTCTTTGTGADSSVTQLVLHINCEVMAHGAEICLLRDLYRAEQSQRDPLVAAHRPDRLRG